MNIYATSIGNFNNNVLKFSENHQKQKGIVNTKNNSVSFSAASCESLKVKDVIQSFIKDKFIHTKLNAFIKDFNPEQYQQYRLDKFSAAPIFYPWKVFWNGFGCAQARMRDVVYDAGRATQESQAKILTKYKEKPNELFSLLLASDKYNNPNIESLKYKNLSLLLSIYKDSPNKIDELLLNYIDKTSVKSYFINCSDNECVNIIRLLKNNPKVLDKLLLSFVSEEKVGRTTIHYLCENQRVNVLNEINNTYKDRPEKLLKMYSTKDKYTKTLLGCEKGGDSPWYRYDESNRTPLDYLNPENKEQLIANCKILKDIK